MKRPGYAAPLRARYCQRAGVNSRAMYLATTTAQRRAAASPGVVWSRALAPRLGLLFFLLVFPSLSAAAPLDDKPAATDGTGTNLGLMPAYKPQGHVAAIPLSLESEFILFHNNSFIFDYSDRKEGPRLGPDGDLFCRYYFPNGSYVATAATRMARQNVHCPHPPEAVRPALIGQPVTVALIQPNKPDRTTIPTFVRYTYDPIRPDPWQPRPADGPPRPHFLCACLTLWYRADFIYEWLVYHQHVHNLTKLFIYDNDSEIDDLRGVHSWLSMLFNVEYIFTPLFMGQYGAISHCILHSMNQCEWTIISDVDEFLYVKETKKGGTFPQLAASLPDTTGTASGLMYNTRAEAILETMPEGGALRNFRCAIGTGNTKFVIHAGRGLQNLSNTVHYPYLQPGQHQRGSWGVFVHMQYLSRSVFARKMMRRVSPSGDAAYYRWDEPDAAMNILFDAKHDNATFPCKSLEPQPYNALVCYATRKMVAPYPDSKASCAGEQHVEDLLLVGLPSRHSGLAHVWLPVSSRAGKALDVGPPQPTEPRYRRVVHVVETPLAGIAALLQMRTGPGSCCGAESGPTGSKAVALVGDCWSALQLQDAALEWVRRHRYFELLADVRQRIEDVEDCTQLCSTGTKVGELAMDAATLSACTQVLQGCHIRPEADPGAVNALTWGQLLAVNTHLAAEISTMGRLYGYDVPTLPTVAPDEPEMLPEEEWPGVTSVARGYLDVFGNIVGKYLTKLHDLRKDVAKVAAKFQGWSNAGEVATKDPLAFIAAEAVAVLPLHSASSEVLNGIVFRAAARRRLRIHIPRSNLYSFKALANVADLELKYSMAVAPAPLELGSIDGLAGARQFFTHAIGTSVKVVTVWDEPVAYYLAYVHNHLRLHGETISATQLNRLVEAGKGANPLASSLHLHSEVDVRAFIDAGFPGLDLVLLSSRWTESLVALRRVFNWTVVDVVDGRAHMLEKSPKLPLVVGRNGTLLTTAMEELPPMNNKQTAAIKALTQLDQMLYDAAQQRFDKLIQTLDDDTQRPSFTEEAEHLKRLGSALGRVCESHPLHAACIYWQLHTTTASILVASTSRAPALDLNGQPVFTYLRRSAKMVLESQQ